MIQEPRELTLILSREVAEKILECAEAEEMNAGEWLDELIRKKQTICMWHSPHHVCHCENDE